MQRTSRYIQVPSLAAVAAVRAAQVQPTSRYIQVPSQRGELQLPGRQSLFRIGGWSCWLESDSATSSGVLSVGIGGRGAVGWNPTQLPFLILCIIGIGGWSCWLESDSATSLGFSIWIGG